MIFAAREFNKDNCRTYQISYTHTDSTEFSFTYFLGAEVEAETVPPRVTSTSTLITWAQHISRHHLNLSHVPSTIFRQRVRTRIISTPQESRPTRSNKFNLTAPTPRIFPLALRLLHTRQHQRRPIPPCRSKTRHPPRRGELAFTPLPRMCASILIRCQALLIDL